MLFFAEPAFRVRIRRILDVMIPILITQLAITGMNLFDTIMSGQAGTVDLAGVAIGANIWMPVFTGLNGIIQALTAIVANYRGAREPEKIAGAVMSGLVLSLLMSVFIILAGWSGLERILDLLSLAPEVHRVALRYLGFVALGIPPLFAAGILRSFVDSMGYTGLTMRLFLLTMPVNCSLNYIFIFGKLGMPRLGGAGAGLGTAITCWLLCLAFVLLICRLPVFRAYHVFAPGGISLEHLREHLRVGLPMGIAIFLETSIFGVECLFVSKFGTVAVAANQAAMSFTNLLYMVPLSFSLALTILTGTWAGARNFAEARAYAAAGRFANFLTGLLFAVVLFLGRSFIASFYTRDPALLEPIRHILTFAVCFQFCDSTAAPIQGILRGYKDVKATFYASLAAYWLISLPFGLVLDHVFHYGPDGYWLGLIAGIFFSAFFLTLRLRHIEQRYAA